MALSEGYEPGKLSDSNRFLLSELGGDSALFATNCPFNSRFSEQPVVRQVLSPVALMSSEEDSSEGTSSESSSEDGSNKGSDDDSEDQGFTGTMGYP